MISQNLHKNDSATFTLDKSLLKQNIADYTEFFELLEIKKSYQIGLSSYYNYLYKFDELTFYGNEVHNLALRVVDSKIVKVHFEIDYSTKEILFNLIDNLGYPTSGIALPNTQTFKDESDKKNPSNWLYENFSSLSWKPDENYFHISISNIFSPQYYSLNNPRLWIEFSIVEKFLKYKKIEADSTHKIKEHISLDSQEKVFESLGYSFKNELSKQYLIPKMFGSMLEFPETIADTYAESLFDNYFEELPFARLYYFYGWTIWSTRNSALEPLSNKCIWYDLTFLEYNADYVEFMKWMESITGEELSFTDIEIKNVDENHKEIQFTINDTSKKWNIDTSNLFETFIKKFTNLTEEFNTEKKFTFYSCDNEQFVLDYANEQEQEQFVRKTKIPRKWLNDVTFFIK